MNPSDGDAPSLERATRLARGLSPVDEIVGDAIERAVLDRHRRRLKRLGWGRAFDPPPGGWGPSDPPPRPGCSMTVLVDGAAAFAAMAAAIRSAQSSVWMTGWYLDAGFELVRGGEGESVLSLLADAAERVDVRVLVWAGSPIPVFQPNRLQAKRAVAALRDATRIRAEMDPHEHPLHCHHEKTLVVDGEVAFVGGIDLTDLKTDRYDTPAHPANGSGGWHDVATQLRGPVVADVQAHFALRWRELTDETLPVDPPPAPAGDHTVQMVRTIAETMYSDVPHGDFSAFAAYRSALSGAEEFIYLENQFLWAPEITAVLAAKLRDPPSDAFRLVIVLPSKAHAGQDDTQGQIGVLRGEDAGNRMVVATLRAVTNGREDPLYVHAKVGIVDDRWLTVGSANLNAHSLFNDTEMNVVTDSPSLARDTRLTLWAEHLEVAREQLERPVAEVVDTLWRPITEEQAKRAQAGEPPTHRLLAMSNVSRRSRRLLGPLNGLFDDG